MDQRAGNAGLGKDCRAHVGSRLVLLERFGGRPVARERSLLYGIRRTTYQLVARDAQDPRKSAEDNAQLQRSGHLLGAAS